MDRIRRADAGGEGNLKKPCTGERWGDGPRAGQGCGGSTMCVRTPHSWGSGIIDHISFIHSFIHSDKLGLYWTFKRSSKLS